LLLICFRFNFLQISSHAQRLRRQCCCCERCCLRNCCRIEESPSAFQVFLVEMVSRQHSLPRVSFSRFVRYRTRVPGRFVFFS